MSAKSAPSPLPEPSPVASPEPSPIVSPSPQPQPSPQAPPQAPPQPSPPQASPQPSPQPSPQAPPQPSPQPSPQPNAPNQPQASPVSSPRPSSLASPSFIADTLQTQPDNSKTVTVVLVVGGIVLVLAVLAIYLVRKFGLRPSRAFKSRINRDQQLDMHEAMGDIPVQSIVRVDPTSSGRYASYPVTTSYPRTGAHEAPHEHDYPQEHEYPHEYAQDHLQEYPEYLGDGAQDHYNAQYYPDGHGTYSGSRH